MIDKTESLIIGQAFEATMLARFKDLIKTNFREDMVEKKDFKQVISFQAKSLGHVLRGKKQLSEHYRWLEIHSVGGDGGSMLSEVDYLVFEQQKYYLVVPRKELFEAMKGKIELTKRLTRAEIEKQLEEQAHDLSPVCYRPYTRTEQRDMIILIPTLDLIRFGGVLIDK